MLTYIKLLKALTTEQLMDELRRRRGVSNDYMLAWIPKEAFYKDLEKHAEAAAKETAKDESKEKDN